MEQPSPNPLPILTGYFNETPSYHVTRTRGSSNWLLIYTCAGSGVFTYAAGELATETGYATLIRPHTAQNYRTNPTSGKWELLWTHFRPRPEWIDWLIWPETAPGLLNVAVIDPSARAQVQSALESMHDLNTGALAQREQFALNALERAILWINTANPGATHGRIDSRIQACMEHLARTITFPTSMDTLAAHFNLSPSRLGHLFTEQVGCTPMQFLEQRRIEKAMQLLALTGHSVTQIAAEVGFENPFYFSMRFKRLVGAPPSAYRNRFQ